MPASTQKKMSPAYTLFPEKIMLVPFESIVGDNPTITSFADINKSNSIVLNEETGDYNISISEDGVEITNGKESVAIQQLDQGGIGDIDERTTSRSVMITINTNGVNHDIVAIKDGLNPLNDIGENLRFNKNGGLETIASVDKLTEGDMLIDDVQGIPLDVVNTGTDGTGLTATVDIANNKVSAVNITDKGTGYKSAPAVTFPTANQNYLDNSYAYASPISETSLPGASGNVTFTYNTVDLVVALDGTETQTELYDKIKTESENEASFPAIIDFAGDIVKAKSPSVSEAGTLSFVDTGTTGLSFPSGDIATTSISTSYPTFEALVETGVASSAVLRSGRIVKEKWMVIMVCDIGEKGGEKYYACCPRAVVSDEEDMVTSMNGEKRTNAIPLKGLKLQSDSDLLKIQNTISQAITDKYNMIFSWNAGDTKYSQA